MIRLEDDYIINVDKMISMPQAHRSDTWTIKDSQFISPTLNKMIGYNTLRHCNNILQIFAMKDNSYILEAEYSYNKIAYFKSNDINMLKSFAI